MYFLKQSQIHKWQNIDAVAERESVYTDCKLIIVVKGEQQVVLSCH